MCILEVQKQKNNTSPFGCTRLSFMNTKIAKIGITTNKISGRGGLPLFLRYSEQIGLYGLISRSISSLLTGNSKGLQLQQFVKQIIAFFIDGTHMAISGFDQSKKVKDMHVCLNARPTNWPLLTRSNVFLGSCPLFQTRYSIRYLMNCLSGGFTYPNPKL